MVPPEPIQPPVRLCSRGTLGGVSHEHKLQVSSSTPSYPESKHFSPKMFAGFAGEISGLPLTTRCGCAVWRTNGTTVYKRQKHPANPANSTHTHDS